MHDQRKSDVCLRLASAFRFNPRNAEEMKSFIVYDKSYPGGGVNVYFPSYYPDGVSVWVSGTSDAYEKCGEVKNMETV